MVDVGVGVESENGWRPATLPPDSDLLIWKTIPGTGVTLQVMRGLPEVFLPAWAADWNAYIEPLRDADSASYTETNSVATSNHLNGTAEDLDWDNHPFQVVGTVTDVQRAAITDMLDFYENWMYWAGNWTDPVDEMHSQMGYNTWNRNTAALDFIGRKIRSDGFSTFRRGVLSPTDPPNAAAAPSTPPPDPATADTAIQVLYDAVPEFDMDTAARLAPLIIPALALAQCDQGNVQRRVAMWLAQIGWESGGFVYTEEIDKTGDYAPYIGRTWIQITWQSNYQAFGIWCGQQGLIDSDDVDQFVIDPESLADPQWAGIGAAWFWITPHAGHNLINDDADAGDVTAVTETINGGDNGLQGRIDRYNQAIALGDRLLLLINATPPADLGGPLDALTPEEQHQLLDDVAEIRAQLGGDLPGWPQNGNDAAAAADLDKRKAAGERLSMNDLLCWIKNHVSTHKAPTP